MSLQSELTRLAHPQSNFTSTFNGTPLGNAKLTLSVNGVDHEYTPSGNDQAVDINGNEVVHIDDPDFVQLLNVANADKCELIIKQDITANGAYRKYRLADCHVLNGDREWLFTCTAGNIEYILAVTEDGSVTPSQRLIPDASDSLPLEDGTASAGTSNQYSRKDHVHPHDSTKEDANNKTSYIDPTINQSGKYLGGSAVNGFVEKRTFAISVPYGTTNSNTFTKILEFDETFDGSRTRGSIFARLKIQFVGTSIRRRLREIDAYIGYELNGQKAFVTFGNCYNTLIDNDLKKLHIVTYDTAARRHIEVYLEHRELTAMTNWISVEVCENFKILEQSWKLTQTSHSSWKIPLASYDWDEVNGASVQPTAAALPTTGVLKTDSYIVQSGNQAPFTYVPDGIVASVMPIAKLAKNSGDTRLVFKLYSSEGWVAIGKVERANSVFKLNFSAISDKPDFDNGVATPCIYLSLLDGVYFVNLKIDSYHTVAKSIAIEVDNENKDWEFFGSTAPDSIGSDVAGTDTSMKADLTAEVIDQGTNVPAPTPSTKVLTKQTDANGREFWKTEQMSDMTVGVASRLQWGGGTDDASSTGYIKLATINTPSVNAPHAGIIASVSWRYVGDNAKTGEGLLLASLAESGTSEIKSKILVLNNRGSSEAPLTGNLSFSLIKISENNYELWGYAGYAWTSVFATILSVAGSVRYPARSFQSTVPSGYSAIPYTLNAEATGSYNGLTSGTAKSISASLVVKTNQTTKNWKKIATSKLLTGYDGVSLTFIVSGGGYINEANFYGIVSAAVHTAGGGSLRAARLDKYVFRDVNDAELLRIGTTNQYEIWVNAPFQDTPAYIIPLHNTGWTVNYEDNVNTQLTDAEYATYKLTNSAVGTQTKRLSGFLTNVTSDYTLPALATNESTWIRVRNAGGSSITITAGTLTRTLSPMQACDVYGYNGSYVQIS